MLQNKKALAIAKALIILSGRQDSNLRPPGPKPGAITGLRYAPNGNIFIRTSAERVGFDPPRRNRMTRTHPKKICGEGGIRTHGTE